MNFLSIFVLIPLLMLAGLWAARGIKAIRGVMVTGASALLIASVVLTFLYLGERSAGNTAEMLFRADTLWYAPLHISSGSPYCLWEYSDSLYPSIYSPCSCSTKSH